MGKSSGSPPAAPDYKGAAEAQAASQRVNQYTPFGSLEWSAVPPSGASAATPAAAGTTAAQTTAAPTYLDSLLVDRGESTTQPQFQPQFSGTAISGAGKGNQSEPPPPSQYAATTTLNPELQRAAEGIMSQAGDTYSQPMDLSSVQDVYDKSYQAQIARLDPYWQQQDERHRQMLANQGIGLGSEAFSNAQRDFGQQRNDAYQQAQLAAISTMPQTYGLAEAQYTMPLNALNAFRTGTQINPSMTAPTNYLGAAQGAGNYAGDVFNYGQQQDASNTQAMTNAALAAAIYFSDRRLKRDIVPLDATYYGYPLYEFRYLWDADASEPHIGVMADEVMKRQPEAVLDIDGYLAVDYGMLQDAIH